MEFFKKRSSQSHQEDKNTYWKNKIKIKIPHKVTAQRKNLPPFFIKSRGKSYELSFSCISFFCRLSFLCRALTYEQVVNFSPYWNGRWHNGLPFFRWKTKQWLHSCVRAIWDLRSLSVWKWGKLQHTTTRWVLYFLGQCSAVVMDRGAQTVKSNCTVPYWNFGTPKFYIKYQIELIRFDLVKTEIFRYEKFGSR